MLAAAAATFLFAHASTYSQMLFAALGVGLAGGSFAVGVAYVSRFFPAERQGTALGIFGAHRYWGAAVANFLAPFVLLAWGWQAVARCGPRPCRHGCCVLVLHQRRPAFRLRQTGRTDQKSFWLELAPLKNLQVWRFALTYTSSLVA